MLPDEAEAALECDSENRILTILSMRSFAGAKEVYDRHAADKSKNKQPLPESSAIELVKEIELAAAKQDIHRERRG